MDKRDVWYAMFIFIFMFLPLLAGMFYFVDIVDPITNHLDIIQRKQEEHERRIQNVEGEITSITEMRKEIVKIRKHLESLQRERKK